MVVLGSRCQAGWLERSDGFQPGARQAGWTFAERHRFLSIFFFFFFSKDIEVFLDEDDGALGRRVCDAVGRAFL